MKIVYFSSLYFLAFCFVKSIKTVKEKETGSTNFIALYVCLIFKFFMIFTFSSHTEYVKRESIVIARVKKKKFSPFDECS